MKNDLVHIVTNMGKLAVEAHTAVEVTHIPKQAFSVIIAEHDDANYGVGGLTLDKVRKQ